MRHIVILTILALMLLSSNCTSPVGQTARPNTSQSGTSSTSTGVVLFNDDGVRVEVAKDSKAMLAVLKYIVIGGAEAKGQMKAMQTSGRLFYVPNGTPVEVIEEGKTVGDVTPMIVRITAGPHVGEKVMCFKSVTRKQ